MSMIPDVLQNEALETTCTNVLLPSYTPTKKEEPLTEECVLLPLVLGMDCSSPLVHQFILFLNSNPKILELIEQIAKGTKRACDGLILVANHARMLMAVIKHGMLNAAVRECQPYVKCSKNTIKKWIKCFLEQKNEFVACYDNETLLKQAIVKSLTSPKSHNSGRSSKLEACTTLIDSVLCTYPDTLANLELPWVSSELQSQLKGHLTWTLELLSKVLRCSESTVSSYLKKLNISLTNQGTKKWPRCFSSDPNYIPKTLAIHLAYLYAEEMGYVLLCFDEKPNIQAVKIDRGMTAGGQVSPSDRFENEGKTHLLALLRPSTGHVTCAFTQDKDSEIEIAFFSSALKQYKDRKILIIMDNLSVHGLVQQQLLKDHPNVGILYTASNASWQNAVESFFSIITRSILKHVSYPSIEALKAKAMAFLASYNEHPSPFHWSLDIKRHFNQVANTLNTLKAVFGDLGALRSWDSKILDDANSSLITTTNKAAQSISLECEGLIEVIKEKSNDNQVASPNEEQTNDNQVSSPNEEQTNDNQVSSPNEEQMIHAVPAFNRKDWSLDKDNVLEFSQRVTEALADPVKAMDLVEKLLKFSEKPSRNVASRKVTQKAIDKAAEKARIYKEMSESAKQATTKNKYRLQHEAYQAKMEQLKQEFSDQSNIEAHVRNKQHQLDENLCNRLKVAGEIYFNNLR